MGSRQSRRPRVGTSAWMGSGAWWLSQFVYLPQLVASGSAKIGADEPVLHYEAVHHELPQLGRRQRHGVPLPARAAHSYGCTHRARRGTLTCTANLHANIVQRMISDRHEKTRVNNT
eukprot:SAG22_NODE_16_length_32723_cov_26.404825_14_plen_117_part_00